MPGKPPWHRSLAGPPVTPRQRAGVVTPLPPVTVPPSRSGSTDLPPPSPTGGPGSTADAGARGSIARRDLPHGALGRSSAADTATGLRSRAEAPLGFTLGPELENAQVPTSVTSHVMVQLPTPIPMPVPVAVPVDRPVRATTRILVAAVPVGEVFSTPAEADRFRAAPFSRRDPAGALSAAVLFGLPGYTPSGQVHIDAVVGDLVLTEDVVAESVAAASVVVLELDGGWAVLDVGVQVTGGGPPPGAGVGPDVSPGGVVAREVAARVVSRTGAHTLDHVLLAPTTPSGGQVLPALGDVMALGTITVPGARLDAPETRAAIEHVRVAQPRMREAVARRLREQLDAHRAEHERGFPIAPNLSFGEARWQTWRDAQVEAVLRGIPPPQLTVEGAAAPLGQLVADVDVEPGGPVADLMDVQWEPAQDEVLYLRGTSDDGDQGLGLASSTGLLLKPVEAVAPRRPTGRPIPGLRPAGPTGATPGVAQRAAPWLGVPAVGKEGLVLARTNRGTGLLFDVGGARRFMPLQALARVQSRLRLSAVEHIAVTHPHTDHVRNILEIIRTHSIHASRLIVADSWLVGRGHLAQAINALRTTTAPALLALGYGAAWQPGTAVARTGVVRGTVALAQGQNLEYLGLGGAHQRYAGHQGHTSGTGQRVPAPLADSASLVYFLGNETTAHRVAVLGDVRGSDIVTLHAAMEQASPGSFRAAFERVRVLVGFGHHFGPDAGTTVADVRGLELILTETLLRTGDLTIVIQSDPTRALSEPGARGGGTSRLLEFARGLGARIVMANEPGSRGGSVDINTRLQVSARGEGVEVFQGAPTPTAALRRLGELREALRLMTTEPELARNVLGLGETPVEVVRAGLTEQVARLEGLMTELIGHRAVLLLEARRGSAVSDAQMEQFRSERSARPVEQIHRDLNQVQGIEARLTPEARSHLQGWRVGRTVTLEALTLEAPRAVADAFERMPAERRQSLRRAYEEYNATARDVDPQSVAPHEQVLLHRLGEQLLSALRQAAEGLSEAERRPIDMEIERLTPVVEDLRRDIVTETRFGRDTGGRVTETQFRVQRGIARVSRAAGPVFGAVMVIHSIQGVQSLAAQATGDAPVPELALRAAGSAYGMHLGIRMIRVQHVGMGKFVLLALLDIGATALAEHATTEDRDTAIAQAVAHNAVNLACMAAGSALVSAGAASLNPVTAFGLAALGGVVMFAGEPLLRLTGLDTYLAEALGFPPRQVTRVFREIEELLDRYEVMMGMRQLAERPPEELRAAGAAQPERVQVEAFGELHTQARASRELETEIMGLLDSAYTRAATSFFGLRELDVLTHRFTRLRHMARHTPEHEDPGRAALAERFAAIDRRLDLSDATEATIRGLEQWTKIDEKFDECHRGLFSPAGPDLPAVSESFRELGWMMSSARYRIDPAAQGALRTAPLLRPGSPARAVYEEELHDREHRLGLFVEQLGRLAAGERPALSEPARSYMWSTYTSRGIARHNFTEQDRLMAPVRATAEQISFGPAQADVGAVLARLTTVRRQYDTVLAEAAGLMPELARTETWADPTAYARAARAAVRSHATVLRRVELAESVLQSALEQAQAQAAIGEHSTPDRARLLQVELESARATLSRRRFVLGIPLPSEVDTTIRERQALADPGLAVALGQTAGTPELSPEETRALRSGRVASAGGAQVSTPRAQLAELDRLQRAAGMAPSGRREIFRIVGDYDITDLFVLSIVHRSVSASENVLVAPTGRRHEQMSGRGHFDSVEVLPLNRAAITLFGSTSPQYVASYVLAPAGLEEPAVVP